MIERIGNLICVTFMFHFSQSILKRKDRIFFIAFMFHQKTISEQTNETKLIEETKNVHLQQTYDDGNGGEYKQVVGFFIEKL